MPFFKAAEKLVYYAHVPKCGGSAVGRYMQDRFGPLAFNDTRYLDRPEIERWTRSSPQHVDAATLARLVPLYMFDAIFTIVRHPVARVISTYHFQLEVEKCISPGMGFSDWLAGLQTNPADAAFAYDNHIRPMNQIVPDGAVVFHLEHGLDGLIPWFDLLTGTQAVSLAIDTANKRGEHVTVRSTKVTPSSADLSRIATLYAVDFARFGYALQDRMPKAAAPVLTPDFIATHGRALRAMKRPFARLRHKITRRIGL